MSSRSWALACCTYLVRVRVRFGFGCAFGFGFGFEFEFGFGFGLALGFGLGLVLGAPRVAVDMLELQLLLGRPARAA